MLEGGREFQGYIFPLLYVSESCLVVILLTSDVTFEGELSYQVVYTKISHLTELLAIYQHKYNLFTQSVKSIVVNVSVKKLFVEMYGNYKLLPTGVVKTLVKRDSKAHVSKARRSF